jgi:hypothetical protein
LLETLLGTCASAGATLVAIIGGLLITRYLGIDSEIRGSKERAAELERASRDADLRFADADAKYGPFRIESGLDNRDAYEELRDAWIDGRGPDIGKLRRIDPGLENYSDAEVQKIANDWMAEIPRADRGLSSVALNRSNDWADVRIDNEFDVKVEAVWEQEFDRRMRELPTHPLLGLGPYLARPRIERKDESHRLRRVRDEAEQEKILVAAQFALAKDASRNRAKPKGLWSGIVMLGILTLTAVVIPILYLTPSSKPGPLTPGLIVTIFFLGVGILFAYMIIEVLSIHRLQSGSEESTVS